jgi:hypothetical protein
MERMDSRRNSETPIPMPPKKLTEVKPPPKKMFFRDLLPATIVRREEASEKKSRLPRGIWWGVAGLLFFFIVGFAISFFIVRRNVSDAIASRATQFRVGIADLENADPQAASREFLSLASSTDNLGSVAQGFGFLFEGGAGTISAFMDATKQFAGLSREFIALENDVFGLWRSGGTDIVTDLKALRGTLVAIDADSSRLSGVLPSLGNIADSNTYLSLMAQSEGVRKFLDTLIPWVASPAPHHILVMLQNPSEIRPTGGFLGSYADITIASGTIANISVRDVADADTAFKKMIVPPKPLQLEVARWRPADANWFFDFGASASETVAFFNESNLYAATASAIFTPPYFDAAIAVSPKVVQDLLKTTGPITVSSTKATFTSDNFLVQIQKIVQAGQASSATYPKQVLRDLMSGLSTRIASSSDADKGELMGMASNWIAEKDVMAYSSDPAIENFLKAYAAAGDVYELPQNFNGDYLAVVDANVNGGKSDLYVSEKVDWTSQIGIDGTLTDSLIVSRKHTGDTSPYWWYKTPNQIYFQAFVPQGSLLTNESGGLQKKITPKANYASAGYSTDPLVAEIESTTQTLFSYPAVATHKENGKMVLATWSEVSAGASTQLSFDYTHHAFVPPASGVVYQFVFEKQAGVDRNYSFEVDAPLGYQFMETGLPSWTYQADDLPGRMIVNLTLEKI